MSLSTTTDRIRKQVVLRAPLERVWRAVSDAKTFGQWFGFDFEGEFVAGKTVRGTLRSDDPDYNGLIGEFAIDRIEPMRLFSYRWHPFAIQRGVDYSHEPMTLVVFELEAAAGGTKLTITESGFDAIPAGRRGDAFEANDEGWTTQVERIEKYLAQTSA
jgi:uncharacterized protein YndB with AHSA1/START domain